MQMEMKEYLMKIENAHYVALMKLEMNFIMYLYVHFSYSKDKDILKDTTTQIQKEKKFSELMQSQNLNILRKLAKVINDINRHFN